MMFELNKNTIQYNNQSSGLCTRQTTRIQ